MLKLLLKYNSINSYNNITNKINLYKLNRNVFNAWSFILVLVNNLTLNNLNLGFFFYNAATLYTYYTSLSVIFFSIEVIIITMELVV